MTLPKIVFEPDELRLICEPMMTAEQMLKQKAIFFMHDVIATLDLNPDDVRRRARQLRRSDQNAWEVMGVGIIWNRWLIRMSVFSTYYENDIILQSKPTQPGWSRATLLKQMGIFRLNEVAGFLGLSHKALRTLPSETKDEFGILQASNGTYFVRMERFSNALHQELFGEDYYV